MACLIGPAVQTKPRSQSSTPLSFKVIELCETAMLFSDRNWRCDNQMTTSLPGRQINPNRCEPARLGSSTLHERPAVRRKRYQRLTNSGAHLGHALVENRNGLIAAAMVTHADGYAKREPGDQAQSKSLDSLANALVGSHRGGFIAKERAIQEDFVANSRDKQLAQIEWLGNHRKNLGFPRQSASCDTEARKTAATLRLDINVGFTPT
jgi:hypothetical protein